MQDAEPTTPLRANWRLPLAFSVDGRNMNLQEIRAHLEQRRAAPRN
jgi:hypothetical protein